MSGLAPAQMSAAERRAELCRLLALGVVRLKVRKSTELSAAAGETPVHNSGEPRGHANRLNRSAA